VPAALVIPPIGFDRVIQSECAGAFFLLNAFIALELYSDFTSPVQRGIDFDLWRFLALVGRALTSDEFHGDPLWPFLEELAEEQEEAHPFSPPDGKPFGEWLGEILHRVRTHLSVRLNAEPARACSLVVRRFGRITTSPSHVDVHFSLAAHPIVIRMGGLDRDPGWIPAAGRHVAFHFS